MVLTQLIALLVSVIPSQGKIDNDLQPLVRLGNVTFTYFDPDRESYPLPGRTDFHLDVNRAYEYRLQAAGAGRTRRLIVTLTVKSVDVRLTHQIRLPGGQDPQDPGYRSLVRHEFDHVAISADPRIRLLLEHLAWEPATRTHDLEPGGRDTEAVIRQRLETDLNRSLAAVTSLVTFNYERLDELTDHGARPLPDRSEFFARLYTPENLREASFPLMDRVAPLLRDEAYLKVRPIYGE